MSYQPSMLDAYRDLTDVMARLADLRCAAGELADAIIAANITINGFDYGRPYEWMPARNVRLGELGADLMNGEWETELHSLVVNLLGVFLVGREDEGGTVTFDPDTGTDGSR